MNLPRSFAIEAIGRRSYGIWCRQFSGLGELLNADLLLLDETTAVVLPPARLGGVLASSVPPRTLASSAKGARSIPSLVNRDSAAYVLARLVWVGFRRALAPDLALSTEETRHGLFLTREPLPARGELEHLRHTAPCACGRVVPEGVEYGRKRGRTGRARHGVRCRLRRLRVPGVQR